MQRPSFRIAVIFAVMSSSSCKPEPVSPTTQFRGRTAKDFCVVFSELCPFKFKPVINALITLCEGADCYEYALSPGSYQTKLVDGDGIYFEAARKVRRPVLLGGDELLDGGVYIEDDGQESQGYFYNLFGQMEQYPLPPCPYSIERCDLGGPPTAEDHDD